MRLSVTVKTRSRIEGVHVASDGGLVVMVRALPVEGKANKRVIEILAEYFGKPKTSVSIVSGRTGKRKIVEIL